MSVQLDLTRCPFSRLGSYFSILKVPDDGLVLHTHHDSSVQAFRIVPVRDGNVLEFDTTATETELIVAPSGGGEARIVISGPKTVRVWGRGVSLRLEMPKERWTTACELPGGAWGFNMSRHGVQLGLEMIVGRLQIDAPWGHYGGFCKESLRMIAELVPGDDGTFDAAVDEFVTTWVRPQRPAFDACRAEAAGEYERWRVGLPEVAPRHEAARDLAAYVNWSATVNPSGHLRRRTMLMSKISMCNVYHWDNAFNAMAHARHDPELAWDQFMVMTSTQDEFGKCAANMNDKAINYTFSNLPIQGWALKRMWHDNPELKSPARMAEAYDYLSGWSEWLCNRTWTGDALPYCTHGFDDWDNATIFDDGVPVVTPDVSAYLVSQLDVVAEIAEELNRGEEAATWRRRRDAILSELIEKLWKDDHFVGVRRPSGKIIECDSLLVCMPIMLGRLLPERVIAPLVGQVREHLTPWGLATEKPSSSEYKEDDYWRGPIWAPTTLLVVAGLVDVGEVELATTIAEAFCTMCVEHGIYENYDPETGKGLCDPAYTWTSSVFMILASMLLGSSDRAAS